MKFSCLLFLLWAFFPLEAFAQNDCTRIVRPDHPSSQLELPSSMPQHSSGKQKAAQTVNFIDEILFPVQDQAGVPRAALCDDLTFLRRVTLDLTGRLPHFTRTLQFIEDLDPNKRDNYIDELLNSYAFAERWAYWFGELFQNTGLVGGERGAHKFAEYLRESIRAHKTLDAMAYELLTARGATFYDGVPLYLLRQGGIGVHIADRVENEVSNISAQLLGVDTGCISCHDGGLLKDTNLFLSKKKRADLWAYAAFMITKEIRARNGDVLNEGFDVLDKPDAIYTANTGTTLRPPRNGGKMDPTYLFTGEEPMVGERRDDAFVRMVTADPQFARNFANRFWAHFMTRGLVEPLDAFDLDRQDPDTPPPGGWNIQPTQPALLNALAQHLRDTGYDIRAFFKTLTQSATYQLSSYYPIPWKATYAAYHPKRLVRRLTGEEVYDQLVSSNRVYNNKDRIGWSTLYNEDLTTQRRYYTWAHQLTDVSYKGTYPTHQSFLQAFGVGDRYQVFRNDELSPAQALVMMNHPLVTGRIKTGIVSTIVNYNNGSWTRIPYFSNLGRIANMQVSNREKVRLTYLNTLVREPGPEEMARALRMVGKKPFTKVAPDLQWVLYNYDEMRHGY